MIQLPNFSDKQGLEFQEKEFILTLKEQVRSVPKVLFYVFLAVIIFAIPVGIFLKSFLAQKFIGGYQPPLVNLTPYHPKDLRVIKTGIIPSGLVGKVSLYAQVVNPNPDISARDFDYAFVLKDQTGQALATLPGQSYLLAQDSKFLLVPLAALPQDTSGNLEVPAAVDLSLSNVSWTKKIPDYNIQLQITQKNTGVTADGKFFVEAHLINTQSLQIKRVEVGVIIFDKNNQNIVAVNSTVINDLVPFEDRYFRILWPVAGFSSIGEVRITPKINLIEPNLIFKAQNTIPVR